VSTHCIEVAAQGPIRVVTLNRPPVNAIDVPLLEELQRTFEHLADDADVGAVVFTGSGSCFSAGLDLQQLATSDPQRMRRLLLTLNRSLLALFSFPRPLVGALNGHTIAGGMMLALCCDYRIAPREACKLGLTEVRVGVTFPIAGLEIARQSMGPETLQHLAQIGRNIDCKEAHRRAVVDELQHAADISARALEVAEDLAQVPRAAFKGTKHQLRGDAIARIQRWVDDDDPAMPIWTDPDTVLGARDILEGRRQT